MSYQKSEVSFEIIDYNNLENRDAIPHSGVTIPLGPYSGSPTYDPTLPPTSISSASSAQFSQPSPNSSEQFISSNNIGSTERTDAPELSYTTDLTETPNAVTIHLFIGVVATLVTFLIWHYVMSASDQTSKGHIWWWMYVPFVFGMSLTAHIHYYTGNYFKAIVVNTVLINVMLFVADAQSVCFRFSLSSTLLLLLFLLSYYYPSILLLFYLLIFLTLLER